MTKNQRPFELQKFLEVSHMNEQLHGYVNNHHFKVLNVYNQLYPCYKNKWFEKMHK